MYTRSNAAGGKQSGQDVFVGWDLPYDSPADAGTSLDESLDFPAFGAKTCPETMLIYAVLNDAIRTFQKQFAAKSRSGQRAAAEAGAWLFSDHDRAPFSFVSLCDLLGLEPEFIRRRLRNMIEQQTSISTARSDSARSCSPHPVGVLAMKSTGTKART